MWWFTPVQFWNVIIFSYGGFSNTCLLTKTLRYNTELLIWTQSIQFCKWEYGKLGILSFNRPYWLLHLWHVFLEAVAWRISGNTSCLTLKSFFPWMTTIEKPLVPCYCFRALNTWRTSFLDNNMGKDSPGWLIFLLMVCRASILLTEEFVHNNCFGILPEVT